MIFRTTVTVEPQEEGGLSKETLSRLKQRFSFWYTPFTKNERLLRQICKHCREPYQPEAFYINVEGMPCTLEPSAAFIKLKRACFLSKPVAVFRFIPIPGGKGIDEFAGIKLFYHTKETNHTPHIHAKYQNEEVSVNLKKLTVTGKMNPKKLKKVLSYVQENQNELLKGYTQFTNGIHLEPIQME